MYLFLRILEKLLIVYFTAYLVIDLLLYIYAVIFFFFRRKIKEKKQIKNFEKYSISIIVPAYNEAVSIVTCTDMLLKLNYPNYQLIVVNDGSKDNTLEVFMNNYNPQLINIDANVALKTNKIKGIYKVPDKNLLFIDKENGGKADAINACINYASGDYICTIDADSILDENALKEVITPFIRNKETIVSGGQLAVANDVHLSNNKVISSKIPKNIWVQWQIIEYIKSYMISRIGLSRLNALLIMSGAFSMFKKDDLLKIGGFLNKINTHEYISKNIGIGKQTVCEDMEIVVRLWKYRKDEKKKAKAVFLPEPVCWTEVPDIPKNLYKQRSRWHQGLGETLKIHRNMIFEPKYGITGLLGLPYYLFFEFLSPLIKVLSLIFIFAAAKYGLINLNWVIMLLISVMLITAVIMSSITAVIEYISHKNKAINREALRYKKFLDWLWLIFAGIIAEFSYSFFKIAAQINGIYNFMKKKHDWKKFERRGIDNAQND